MNIRNVNFQNNFDISRLSLMKNINNSFNNFHYLNSPNDLNMNLSSILNSIHEKLCHFMQGAIRMQNFTKKIR